MAETTTITPEVTAQAPIQPVIAPPTPEVVAPALKEDLVSRVSKVKVEKTPPEATNPFGLSKEDYDKVTNEPTLSKFYKSMQADYVKKTQEAAELKKQSEAKIKEASNWTPERLQLEMNNPEFIRAATQVAGMRNPPNSGLNDQQWSALTEQEKAQMANMQQQVNQLQMQNWNLQQRQQDEQLKGRYANYNSDIVDVTVKDLVAGKVTANREYVWKAIDYEDAVNRAYQLGLQDRQAGLSEKQQASSPEGLAMTPTNQVPPIEKGESNTAYFRRLADRRLEEAKGRNK